ncbi:MAG TPA: sigma factor [Gemmatimonadales bacterium]|nr:sigma factor [Gemmatimonadales bacterium]
MAFPETRLSLLEGLKSGDQETRDRALDLLVRAYRAPVLADLVWRWGLEPADAEDLVQDFFAMAMEKGWFDRFEPARGRFRTFVRMAAQRYASNWHEAAARLRRGGGAAFVEASDATVPGIDGDLEADRRFREEWVRNILGLALEAFRAEAIGKDRQVHFALFESYDLLDAAERPTYTQLGRIHSLGDSEVINHLAWARRRFRFHVLEVLRRLAGNEAEYREDVRDLFGVDVS